MISELCALIVDAVGHKHLDNFPWILRARNKDLAALARVSRTFSIHALNRLWKELDTFGPLMSLLPSDPVKDSSDRRQVSSRLFRGMVKSI